MKLSIQAGSTSQSVNVFVRDSSSTTGGGLTGLVFNTSGLTAYYALPKAAAVSITLATLAAITTAYSSGGFKEIDATNMPGWYRLDIPDAALASGRFVSLHLKGATNMVPLPVEIELTATNNQSATSFITAVNGIAQTGDSYARIGAAGAGLTALGDTRIAHLDADVSSRSTYAGGDTSGTTTLLSRIASALTITGGKVDVNDKTGFSLSTAGILAIWHQLTAAIVTAGTIGKLLVDDIDAAISSRSTYAGGAVASVTAPVTAGTVTDKTGYALTAAYDPAKTAAQAGDAMALTSGERTTLAGVIWSVLTSALTTAGSIGKLLVDKIDATISSRSTYAGGDTAGTTTLLSRLTSTRAALLDNLDTAVSGVAAAVWTVGTRTITSFGTIVADVATAVWGAVTRSLTDKAGFSLTSAYDAAKTAGDATAANQTTINANVLTRLATSGYTAPPTSAANAGAVWDEALSGHTVAGSAGAALSSAGAAADPWATSLPGSYAPGTAGDIIGNLDVPTADGNADALLDRAAGVETGWTIRQAMRIILGVLAGKTNGANTTSMAFRDTADTKNRVAVTLDINGNRTAVSTDAS